MEVIFGILFIFFIIGLIRSAISGTADNESIHSESQHIGPLEIRQVPFHLGDNGEGPLAIGIELRGLIPIEKVTDIGFSISVIDTTDYDKGAGRGSDFVLCLMEGLQEEETTAFQMKQIGPKVEPGHGWVQWNRVGSFVPELLVPGYSGRRELAVMCRIVDMDNLPVIERGFCESEQAGVIAELNLKYTLDFQGKGYFEAAEERDAARKAAIRLAMVIAMDDGELHEKEGYVIKHWVERTLSTYSDERQTYLKKIYNEAMREGYAAASKGRVSLGGLTEQLNEIADTAMKYEAVQLCLDVMTADGSASDGEMRAIRNIAKSLELDYDEFETLKDKSLLGIITDESSDVEALLGIQPDWTSEQIRKHLAREYAKWNSRVTSFAEGPQRETAQNMLNTIAIARTRYDQ